MASLGLVMLQGSDSSEMHVLMACFILITVVIVVQAIVLIGAGMAARKSQQRLLEIAEEIKKTATPFLSDARTVFEKTGKLIDDVGPAMRSISRNVDVVSAKAVEASGNVVEATERFKAKAQEFDELTTEIRQRTQLQVRRVDGLVTNGLEAVADIGASIHRAVLIPVREIGAIMNGVKAGLDTLMGKAKRFGVYSGGRDAYRDDEIGL